MVSDVTTEEDVAAKITDDWGRNGRGECRFDPRGIDHLFLAGDLTVYAVYVPSMISCVPQTRRERTACL